MVMTTMTQTKIGPKDGRIGEIGSMPQLLGMVDLLSSSSNFTLILVSV